MHQYGVRDVERLLRLSRSTIRTLIEAGFVSPARGPRNAWQFSFQDLIVLRTAQALAEAKVPRRRITRSIKELRRHLPETMPLSGLSICAVADRVVVKEGGSRWQADSGQYLLAFEGDPADGSLSVIERGDAEATQRGRLVRARRRAGKRGCRRRAPGVRARHRRRPDVSRRLHQPRIAAPRSRAPLGRRARLSRGDRKRAATTPRCSTTSASCSTISTAGTKRWKSTKPRCMEIPIWRIATTTSRCCARSSQGPGKPSGTWRSIGG